MPDADDDSWVPEDALANLTSERTLNPAETEEQLARRLLKENVPQAVLAIIHTSQHGTSERVRLDASKYIVERVLGKVGDDAYGEISPLTKFLDQMASDAEAHANGGN
jgi:sensor histidine kinase regulating citrate/malate metabolism